MKIQTEVLIIGGGGTGVGISRDLALRGIPSVLIEKGDLASGASGRNHGLLHSGGRYAVSDPEAARECIAENRHLRKIAPHCIEETEGLFITLPEDGLDFREKFLRGCEEVGIQTALLIRDDTLELEPELNPNLLSAVKVPDGAIDPFALVLENAKDAEEHGAKIFLHTDTSLIMDGDKIREARAKDLLQEEEYNIEASFLVNATTNAVVKLACAFVVAEDPAGAAARWARFAALLPAPAGGYGPLAASRGHVLFATRGQWTTLLGEAPAAPALAGYALECRDPAILASRCRRLGLPLRELRRNLYAASLPPALGGCWIFGTREGLGLPS